MTRSEKALNNVSYLAKIAFVHGEFIILAQNDIDARGKVAKINRGDTLGFYTIERALKHKKHD